MPINNVGTALESVWYFLIEKYVIENVLFEDFLGLDGEVRGGTLHHAADERLVQERSGIGQQIALALGTAAENDRPKCFRLPAHP